MHNCLLDTFLVVAEERSFSKAAAKLYITPSAVSQKMSELEAELGVPLFVRSSQGISLTEQGIILRREGLAYVAQGKQIRKLLLAVENSKHTITVGTSPLEKCRALFDLWMKYSVQHPDDRIILSNIDTSSEIPSDIDIIESVCDEDAWQKNWDFIEVGTTALCVALDRAHPLSKKDKLTIDDLRQRPLVIINRERNNHVVAEVCEKLRQSDIELIFRPDLGANVIWECSSKHYSILIPECWHDVVFDVDFKMLDWDYTMPYGIFYRKKPSSAANRFISFAASECAEADYLSRYTPV